MQSHNCFCGPETLKKALQGRFFFGKKSRELIPHASLLLLRLAGGGNAVAKAILVHEALACQGEVLPSLWRVPGLDSRFHLIRVPGCLR